MSNSKSQTYWSKFLSLIVVFFFWGFVASSNDILIPVFKQAFNLTQGQSQLVALAFYISYTVGALIYMGISFLIKQDLIQKIGFKNSLSIGLLISALGTLLFYPAANNSSYPLMLAGLFIVGLGFSLQQTVANPLAIILGSANSGSQRLTMAGGINNLGTTIGPLIVSFAIFGTANSKETTLSIESVKIPYLILGAVFLLVAIILKFSSLPNKVETNLDLDEDKTKIIDRKSALNYPQLVFGMIAIFAYVGTEVSVASNLPAFMEKSLDMKTNQIAPYISLYWASLMIGRWAGAAEAFSFKTTLGPKLFKFFAPYLAFTIFLLVNKIANNDLTPFYVYTFIIIVLIFADILSNGNPAKMISYFSILAIIALIIGIFSTGMLSVYCFISIGLFCSTLWPCIFSLSVAGLGKNTSQGSNYLIMMIMGGGLISWLQGIISEKIGIQNSYFINIFLFGYLFWFSIKASNELKKQGINLEKSSNSGH